MIYRLFTDFLSALSAVTRQLGQQGHLTLFEFSLHLHAHVGAELGFLHDLLKERGLLVILVWAAKDLTNLG